MDTQTAIISGSAGIAVTLLVMLGINLLPEDTHYCENLKDAMHCDRLSASLGRCYPTEGTTKGYKDCSTGWVKIDFEQAVTPAYTGKYICSPSGCVPA